MNCNTTELYMNTLLDNKLSVKDSLEVVEHIESCSSCKSKWELNEESRSKFKHFINLIKASPEFRKRISKSIYKIKTKKEEKVVYVKPILIAASIAFLLGLGLMLNPSFTKMPTLGELHNKTSIQLATNDIKLISNHINVKLQNKHLSYLELVDFKIEGAAKIKKPFIKNIGVISLKNNNGQKVSICFLPKNYQVPMCKKVELNGIIFNCGESQNCHFAYWRDKENTIALVSDSFTPEEIIYFALPLAQLT